ncbi:membrane integrity-associated transporter subunit PqiC [bacterium AH-315-E07]|nr:membrane integrity-associated transporter subunit PqiC [bacterium AH-315-E07]
MQKIPQNRLTGVLLVAMLGASALMAGCTLLGGQGNVTSAKTYLLHVAEESVARRAVNAAPCLTLTVSAMRAAPGFVTPRIAYVQKKYQLDYFAHHQWVDTPANMLTTIVTQALEGSHLFHAVVESPAAITTDLRLDSELLHLQQVFNDGASIVQLQLRVLLIDQVSRGVVASDVFSFSESALESTPYGGVVAANRVVTRLAPELVSFIDKATHDLALSCQR